MKVVIVGAGALGSLYAACLARDGHDVSLVARGERAPALAKHGISVTGADDFTARCDIVTEPQRLRACDLLILATKTYDPAGALQSLRELKVGSAFSVQNGVQKNDALAQAFGASAVFGAVTMIGAEVLAAQGDEPGAVRYTRAGMTTIGAIAGGESARVAEAVKITQAWGEKVKATAPEMRPSMLNDAERGRRLEVGETLDYTLTLANRFYLPAPTLDLCCRVLRMLSRLAQ